jgi:hypothetical protein
MTLPNALTTPFGAFTSPPLATPSSVGLAASAGPRPGPCAPGDWGPDCLAAPWGPDGVPAPPVYSIDALPGLGPTG